MWPKQNARHVQGSATPPHAHPVLNHKPPVVQQATRTSFSGALGCRNYFTKGGRAHWDSFTLPALSLLRVKALLQHHQNSMDSQSPVLCSLWVSERFLWLNRQMKKRRCSLQHLMCREGAWVLTNFITVSVSQLCRNGAKMSWKETDSSIRSTTKPYIRQDLTELRTRQLRRSFLSWEKNLKSQLQRTPLQRNWSLIGSDRGAIEASGYSWKQ